jgi:hypothetical protein
MRYQRDLILVGFEAFPSRLWAEAAFEIVMVEHSEDLKLEVNIFIPWNIREDQKAKCI